MSSAAAVDIPISPMVNPEKQASKAKTGYFCTRARIDEPPPGCSPAPDENRRHSPTSVRPALDPSFAVDTTEGILLALAQAIEQRDRYTAGHCERLALISVSLGVTLGLETAELLALYRGGYLHDIGKVGIPDAILFKPKPLTAHEWVTMRSHPARGEEICRHLASLQNVLPIIRHHHERWDGSGYPDGTSGACIPLLARVLQIADIYDALTSRRPYKPALPAPRALEILQEETARGWRDPEIVELFVRLHDRVMARIPALQAGANGNLDRMRESLANLHRALV